MAKKKPKYETPTGMRQRGWTPTLINRFIGGPDEYFDNPHYRSGAPMRAYLIDRVQAAEANPMAAAALTKVLENREARSAGAKRGADTRREKLAEWAKTTPLAWLNGTPENEDHARTAGVDAWNASQMERGNYDASGESAGLAHHDRWAENWAPTGQPSRRSENG